MTRILFVCHGNIRRSPMAEFVMRDMVDIAGLSGKVEVASAATSTEQLGEDIHYGTRGILEKYRIPHTPRSARQITKADYDDFDYIIGMDSYNIANMRRAFGGDPDGKVSTLLSWAGSSRDVDDPWYTGDFESTYRDVLEGCAALLKKL